MIKKSVSILTLSIFSLWGISAQSLAQSEAARQLVDNYGYLKGSVDSMGSDPYQEESVVRSSPVMIEMGKGGNSDSSSIFGHEFLGANSANFSTALNIPTPANYIIAAGDELIIELSGDVVKRMIVSISPEGSIYLPEFGSIYLMGESIASAREKLRSSLARIYSGLNSSDGGIVLQLTLGGIRSVVVNVVGDVAAPGNYTLPSLATTLSAIYAAGGVNDRGSVRNISLYRDGVKVDDFDLYDFIFNGFMGEVARLQDNDLIVVSGYSGIVGVSGGVKRPMRYEVVEGETISDLLDYCGGFVGNANGAQLYIERSSGAMKRSFVIESGDFDTFQLSDGDMVTVMFNSDINQNRVYIGEGVIFPGNYALSDKISTLGDLIEAAGGVTEEAYRRGAYIYRRDESYIPMAVSVDLEAVLNGVSDVILVRNDSVKLFSGLELYNRSTINVSGAVNRAGEFEFRKGMTLCDAILLADGFAPGATMSRIEVARRNVNENSVMPSDTVAIVYRFDLVASPASDTFALAPFDMVMVRYAPDYRPQQSVMVTGEVLFPGVHVVESDEVRLSDVVAKVGGFMPGAYVRGAKLIRHLNSDEVERLRLASEIANEKLKSAGDTLRIDPAKLGDSYDIAIDLVMAIKNPGSDFDVVLRGGDEIRVPKYNNTVKISGGVMVPHTVTYNPDYTWRDYVGTSGGFVKRAIKNKAYFVYMNGTISTRGFGTFKAEPGCELVIPEKSINRSRFSLAEGLSLSTSLTSLAAILVTLFRN